MSSTWLLLSLCLGLLLLALGVLLWPLLREAAAQELPEADARGRLRSLYQAQRDELERQLEQQTLSIADHEQTVEELQRRMLVDIDGAPAPSGGLPIKGRWRERVPAAALAVLMPLAAVALYVQVGDPRAALALAQRDPATHASEGVDADAMVQRLAQRLAEQPDDLQGWLVLARSREVQEDFGAAAQAYRRAIELAAAHKMPVAFQARLHADLADVLASGQQGALDGPVAAALAAALALDATQPKALALAGTAALRQGDSEGARRYWQRLLGQLEPGSDMALRVQRDLAALAGGGVQVPELPRGIAGRLILGAAARAQVRPDDTVFVIVRAKAAGAVPVAILRLSAGELPAAFEIDDRHAMTPDRPMSAFAELTIEARISRSGQAERRAGQPASPVLPVRAGARDIELHIEVPATASAPG